MFYKTEKEKTFCYSANVACDDNNFILGFTIDSGNVHDSTLFKDTYEQVRSRFKESMKIVAVDSGYVTPHICKTIFDDGLQPAIPYKRPMTKKGFFRKYEYVYDEHYDCYICPNNKLLHYSTTNREGYREYKSHPEACSSCPHLSQCTESQNHQKVITRHVWQDYVDEANHLRHVPLIKGAYKRRKETIERVFADAKEKHGMRYTQLRGMERVEFELMLKFACMNLKKMAKRKWYGKKNRRRLLQIYLYLVWLLINDKKTANSLVRVCGLSTV